MINGMNIWKMFGASLVIAADSYKASHSKQYPKGTRKVISYLEARGSSISDFTVFFGLQYYLKTYLEGVVVTKEDVDKAEKFWDAHFGSKIFDRAMWDHIVDNLGGKLPLKIRAVREGTKVANRNVLMVIENSDEKCFSLTNFVETLLMKVWYSTTIATHSNVCRDLIMEYLVETGSPELISFNLHDFGYRGVTSEEQAMIGGMAHLTAFLGTDNVAGIWAAQEIYNTSEMLGFSIPASEHSTITSWGEDHEIDAFRNMLKLYPTGHVACVSDSFHILKAMDKWGVLKDDIMSRDGTLVIRPDSGDPARTDLAIIEKLGDIFGYTVNAKGYKVLDSHIRVIQGDGVNRNSIAHILQILKDAGWSADNIAFGCGGKLLQAFDRDSFNFAIKCCEINLDGGVRYIEKSPVEINENGDLVVSFKKSKKGNMKLVKDDNLEFITVTALEEGYDAAVDALETVFENGEILRQWTFEEIRGLTMA